MAAEPLPPAASSRTASVWPRITAAAGAGRRALLTAGTRSATPVGTTSARIASTPSSAAATSRPSLKGSPATPAPVSTGPATAAPRGRISRRRRWVPSVITCTFRPASMHASAASTPAPPAFEKITTRRPAGGRLAAEQRHHVEQFPQAGGGDDARLLEQRLPGDQRGSNGSGVRGGGALARGRPARVHGEHRHLLAGPAGGAAELAGVTERLHVQHR